MNEWILIFGMMAVTFAVRYPVLALVGKIVLPDPIFRALRYVPPAVLTAIIVPGLLIPDGESVYVSVANSYLVAGVISGGVAWITRDSKQGLLLTILIGMGVFLLHRFVLFG